MARQYNIAVVPGDHIGKEVVPEALRVLRLAGDKYGFSLNETNYPNGGEHYAKTGVLLPDCTIREWKGHHAVLLGAVGVKPEDHPNVAKSIKAGIIEQDILIRGRFEMGQYVNLRPSKVYAGVDAPIKKIHQNLPNGYQLHVIRENTGGLYKGKGSLDAKEGEQLFATQVMEYEKPEVERIIRYAFEHAVKEGEKLGGEPLPLTMGFKSNVLKYVSAQLWSPVFEQIAAEYPNVQSNYAHIDALVGPWVISNPLPERGWVIVTGNMFGDILTDLTASLFGGMGTGASACINPEGTSMFEPVHGSSPKDAGKDIVSPIAAILSGAMMLENIGEPEAAKGIETAVENALASGKIPNLTIHSGVPTQKQTDLVIQELRGAA